MISIILNILVGLLCFSLLMYLLVRGISKFEENPLKKICIKKFDVCLDGKIVSFADTTISTPTPVKIFVHNGEVKTSLFHYKLPEDAILLCHIYEEEKI